MKNLLRYIFVLIGAVVMASCSKEGVESTATDDTQTNECHLTIGTKADTGTALSGLIRLGLYKAADNSGTLASPIELYSDDIPVMYGYRQYTTSTWGFKYEMYSTSYDITDISFFSNSSGSEEDYPPMILGISPEFSSSYSTGEMTSLAVKFNSYSTNFANNTTDLRYVCQQVEEKEDGSYYADILFKQLFAGINLNIKSTNNSDIAISKIVLQNIRTGGTTIKTSGNINVTDGTVVSSGSSSSLNMYTASLNTSGTYTMIDVNSTKATSVTRYIAPISGNADDIFVLSIYLNEQTDPIDGYVYLKDTNGNNITEFEQGVMYTVNITIDDYLKFSGVTISGEFDENSEYGVTL